MLLDTMSSQPSSAASPYRGLIYRVFQQRREHDRGIAIAVAAPHQRAGTSYLVKSLALELGSYPSVKILQVDLSTLAGTLQPDQDVFDFITPTATPSVSEIESAMTTSSPLPSSTYWYGSIEHRRQCIDRLRDRYQYILLDCPPVLQSGEVLGIASLVDGLLLVVEADRTTKEQVTESERQIEDAGGRIYGTIFNKNRKAATMWSKWAR